MILFVVTAPAKVADGTPVPTGCTATCHCVSWYPGVQNNCADVEVMLPATIPRSIGSGQAGIGSITISSIKILFLLSAPCGIWKAMFAKDGAGPPRSTKLMIRSLYSVLVNLPVHKSDCAFTLKSKGVIFPPVEILTSSVLAAVALATLYL
ncbi:hypothetical protein D3C86_938220 [compost metagenome]